MAKVNNKILIQHGKIAATSADSTVVTFPTAFTNANYKVFCVLGASRSGSQQNICASARTTTTFTRYCNGGTEYKTQNFWLAIGY